MRTLTPKQRAFLGTLLRCIRQSGESPTIRDLQEAAGLRSSRTVIQYLNALEKAGVITRGDGPRNIRIVRQASTANTAGVPVIGRVAAGQPILAEENFVDEIQVDRAIAPSGHRYYFLEVQGDSMDNAGIQDGDYLLVRYQEAADDGAIVVVLVNDSATVKRLRRSRDVAILQPVSSNPMHRPIIVGADFMVQGVVVASFPREQLMT